MTTSVSIPWPYSELEAEGNIINIWKVQVGGRLGRVKDSGRRSKLTDPRALSIHPDSQRLAFLNVHCEGGHLCREVPGIPLESHRGHRK